MTYFDDLDELYRHMQDGVAYLSDIAHPLTPSFRHQLVVDKVVYFTRKLHNVMLIKDLPATYIPTYDVYGSVTQQIVLAEDGIRVVVNVSRYDLYSGTFYTRSTQRLFSYLEYTLPLYREMVFDIRRRRAIYNHCKGCHYIDNRVEYCGMGNVLDAECSHHTPMEVMG